MRNLVSLLICHFRNTFLRLCRNMMASAASSAYHEMFNCNVCFFTVQEEPVALPCGHKFCTNCMKKSSSERADCRCPLCQCVFAPEALSKNAQQVEMAEQWTGVGSAATEPMDVPCDVCIGVKRKAAQTCVTCLASFCETHIQPHKQSEALKRHRLEEPTSNLQQKLCPNHRIMLQLYCRTDQKCVCLLCVAVKHKDHELVEMETERAEKQAQMDVKRKEIESSVWKKQRQVALTIAAIEELRSIQRLRSEVTVLIRNYEQREVRKAEELIQQLEKEIEEQKRNISRMAELSQTDDHIDFLQKFSSVQDLPIDGDTPSIPTKRRLLPGSVRMDICSLQKYLNTISSLEFVEMRQTGLDEPNYVLQSLMERSFLLKYACPLSLDANTVNGSLRISEENTMVNFNTVKAHYLIHPDRFERWPQVLCREALFGRRYYWEVKWSGEHADIGVAYNGICRKSGDSKCLLGGNDKSWSLVCSGSRCSVRHNGLDTVISAPSSQTIGVYLDWHAGTLSFYSISDTPTLLFRFHTTFAQPLYPGFRVTGSVKICQLN
ncbi:tripartite motif-containing protein 16-like isoform X2 [Erpetoichthys calabaricus]|uniref:tripartite motif-containing protein 16-like isoform X2 n=1 Tax=Erpetoichthys calabaricus TaxID=27687 RepID=UPI00109FD450|nr:tripartite motif-containing protein 16-like isoform X2 [Erpetoichthys calabaricus]